MGWPRTNLEASGGQVLGRNVRLIQQLLDVPDNYGPGRDILKNEQDILKKTFLATSYITQVFKDIFWKIGLKMTYTTSVK